ncbi:hypothetical protein CMUS01_04880 [Colletotrichum musicola]|uniref:Ubiquitin-like domain-containing protein n=1 Tax=Colletotrichum musicola TaxID=2175873 RepID=A0A8H6NMA1_9PEZI|nr:hypothetical protein CMUS01_04880 [Colletotrichum musicola]
MDPLSLTASMSGISQTGTSLSKAIYDLISSTRGAPKEISDIARGIADFSVILRELRRVLKDGVSLFRPRLVRHIRSATKRIGAIHDEVGRLIDVVSGVARLKWAFRRSATTQLLYQIEAHKNAINMILHTMALAIQIKVAAAVASIPQDNDPDDEDDRFLRRQQTENVVQASYQSLVELNEAETAASSHAEREGSPSGDEKDQKLTVLKETPKDTARWLYDVAFSSYAEVHGDGEADVDSQAAMSQQQVDISTLVPSAVDQQGAVGPPLRISRKSINPKVVVDELLAEWTALSNEEISGDAAVNTREGQTRPEVAESSQTGEGDGAEEAQALEAESEGEGQDSSETSLLHLKDAVGRKFSFPFRLVESWEGMSQMIGEAFLNTGFLNDAVQQGLYTLYILEGKRPGAVRPEDWSDTISSGEKVEMKLRI